MRAPQAPGWLTPALAVQTAALAVIIAMYARHLARENRRAQIEHDARMQWLRMPFEDKTDGDTADAGIACNDPGPTS